MDRDITVPEGEIEEVGETTAWDKRKLTMT